MSTTWEYKNFALTRYWGKDRTMWQLTQGDMYIQLNKHDINTIIKKIKMDK